MKLKHILVAASLGIGVAVVNAQEVKLNIPAQPDAQAPAAVAPAAPTDTEILESWGWFVGKRIGLTELEFSKEQIAALTHGITLAASGAEAPHDLQKIGPAMDAFIQQRQSVYMGKLKNKGMEETAKFLADVKTKPGVKVLPSGLCYEVIAPGTGDAPKPAETVKVNYTGTLIDGTEFDSSVKRGQPAEFVLDKVIPGWTEGLQKISKGGKIKLYIPPHLAYGDDGRPGIPPSSTLIFDVELLDIMPTPVAAKPAAPAANPSATPEPPEPHD